MERWTAPARSLRSSGMINTLVATRGLVGRSRHACPTISSDLPLPYTGARSSMFTPPATAAFTVSIHSSSVVGPHTMPIPPPPKVRTDTENPVLPRVRCSIGIPPFDWSWLSLDTPMLQVHLAHGVSYRYATFPVV